MKWSNIINKDNNLFYLVQSKMYNRYKQNNVSENLQWNIYIIILLFNDIDLMYCAKSTINIIYNIRFTVILSTNIL